MMTYRIESKAENIDQKEWEQFVYNHPQGNVFQTPQMYAIYCSTRNYQPLMVACFEKNILVGILLAVVQKEYKGLLGKLSARSIIWGGPLVRENDIRILERIMSKYNRTIKIHAIYTQIRNIFPIEWAKNGLEKLGYKFEDHLNILINLEKSEEQLWKEIHPKRKNEIKRATKEGTTFTILTDNDSLEKCWSILNEVYHRARLPLPHISLFKETLTCGEKNSLLKIFAALNNRQIIGVLLALCWRDRVIDWYAGSYKHYLNKYPNDLLPWEVIRWGKQNGYKKFDFGGAGKPGVPYGVRDYKKKFGGEFVNYGRYEKIHKPILYQVAKLGFKLYQKIKK